MAPTYWLCGSLAEGFRKGTMSSAHLSVWEKALPQLLPWCQTFPFLFVCNCCLSSHYPSAGAQREWVWVSLSVGSLRGTAWDSRSFFHRLGSCCFLQPEVMGTFLPGIEPWAGWPGIGLGLLTPVISLPSFYLPHIRVGPACSAFLPLLPVWMDVFFFLIYSSQNSIQLNFWLFWVMAVL